MCHTLETFSQNCSDTCCIPDECVWFGFKNVDEIKDLFMRIEDVEDMLENIEHFIIPIRLQQRYINGFEWLKQLDVVFCILLYTTPGKFKTENETHK